jgi:uncharacterized cupredoxin-like copper-binding protein
MRRFLVPLALLCAAAACSRPVGDAPRAHSVTITASDYAFGTPDTIPAGLTTLVMVNTGAEPHQLGIARLAAGKTMADVQAALASPGAPPPWMTFVGGSNLVAPGDTSNSTQVLEPGTYLLVCFIPSADGKPHFAKGMLHPLVVAGPAPAPAAPEPTGDVTITLKDYGFDLSHPLRAGTHTIRVENAGPQLHEVMVLALAPGKSAGDVARWAAAGMREPPPFRPLGGIVGLTPGRHAEFTIALAPGRYALACFVPDARDGKEHLAHGMIQEITVT